MRQGSSQMVKDSHFTAARATKSAPRAAQERFKMRLRGVPRREGANLCTALLPCARACGSAALPLARPNSPSLTFQESSKTPPGGRGSEGGGGGGGELPIGAIRLSTWCWMGWWGRTKRQQFLTGLQFVPKASPKRP
eukprot:4005462-Pyramimonas_sp.AAC.1